MLKSVLKEADNSAPSYKSSYAPQEQAQEADVEADASGDATTPPAPVRTNAAPLPLASVRSSVIRSIKHSKLLITRADAFTLSLFKRNRTARFWASTALITFALCLLQFWRAHHGQGWGIWAWLMESAKTKTAYDPTKGITLETDYRQPHFITLAQPLLAVGAGVIAWMQFKRNYEQKEKDIERQKNEFIKKQEADRLQFEEKAQEDRFKDIQDRFASSDDKTRANASLRLAEMALLPKPDAKDKPICDENYPFFLRAVAPLAIALHMEEDASVRSANKEALSVIVEWVKGKEKNDLLLRALIAKLYNANLTAKRAFIKALAEHSNTQPNGDPDVELLTAFAFFTDNKEATQRTLRSLINTPDFKRDCIIDQKLHGISPNELIQTTGRLLAQVKLEARRLMDTRDALAIALCGLSYSEEQLVLKLHQTKWGHYERQFDLQLDRAFLAGANLSGANLIAAQLTGAYLNRAQLDFAKLAWASLNTELYMTRLYKAVVDVVDNEDSRCLTYFHPSWREADFTGSYNKDWKLWKCIAMSYGTDEEQKEAAAMVIGTVIPAPPR